MKTIYNQMPLWSPEDGAGGTGSTTSGEGTQSQSAQGQQNSEGTSQTDPWFKSAGLPEEYHADPNVTRYATIADYAKGNRELATALGSQNPADRLAVYVKANEGKPEALDAVFNVLGRPAKAEEYGLQVADGAPEWLGKFATATLPAKMHALGVTKAQMDGFGAAMNESFAEVLTAEAKAKTTAISATEDMLKSKYGGEWEAAQGVVKSVIKTFGGEKADELSERLNLHFGDTPAIFEAFYEYGKGKQEPIPPRDGGGNNNIGGFGDLAAAQTALRTFDADKDNYAAIMTRGAANRQDVLNKRNEIISAISAFEQAALTKKL